MIKLKQILQERKQVGIIYHFTSLRRAASILYDNQLNRYTTKNNVPHISFTRNKDFWNNQRYGIEGLEIKFIVDGDRLSDKYKIQPYNYFADQPITDTTAELYDIDEMEEVVISKKIEFFSDYIKEVVFRRDDEEVHGRTRLDLNIDIEKLQKECEKKHLKLTILKPYNDFRNEIVNTKHNIIESKNIKFSNWIIPDKKALELEYNVEYKNHTRDIYGDIWPTFKDFYNTVKQATVKEINNNFDNRIGNRSKTKSYSQLIGLVSMYQSWPKYRNEQTVKDIYTGFKTNKPMKMPLILKNNNNYTVMSGNTRMDIAFQLGINPKALIIDI